MNVGDISYWAGLALLVAGVVLFFTTQSRYAFVPSVLGTGALSVSFLLLEPTSIFTIAMSGVMDAGALGLIALAGLDARKRRKEEKTNGE